VDLVKKQVQEHRNTCLACWTRVKECKQTATPKKAIKHPCPMPHVLSVLFHAHALMHHSLHHHSPLTGNTIRTAGRLHPSVVLIKRPLQAAASSSPNPISPSLVLHFLPHSPAAALAAAMAQHAHQQQPPTTLDAIAAIRYVHPRSCPSLPPSLLPPSLELTPPTPPPSRYS
jgi:hypothetical protein